MTKQAARAMALDCPPWRAIASAHKNRPGRGRQNLSA
jgi:hypothetical protein